MEHCHWGIPGLRPEEDYTDEELEAFGEFTEALVKGERPSLAAHLAKYPEHGESLRPALEAAEWFIAQVQEWKITHPDFSIWDLCRKGTK